MDETTAAKKIKKKKICLLANILAAERCINAITMTHSHHNNTGGRDPSVELLARGMSASVRKSVCTAKGRRSNIYDNVCFGEREGGASGF